MAKKEWGSKHICPDATCGARFYDLLRDPVHCPKCGRKIVVESASPAKPDVEDDEPVLADGVDVSIDGQDESDVAIDENVLDESDDDSISLDEITDVPGEDED